ncbi:MAG: hypothetical protein JKY31_02115, partial [Rhodobacteraceae bacterium]|nr:hypothetical protein [Paracoccaceae bacterium]
MKLLYLVPLLFSATLAHSQTLFVDGESLSDAQSRLMALQDKSPDDQFALGAVHFLRGVEKTLQTRWQHNARMDDLDLPVLRLPIAPNPNADPFTADLIVNLFSELREDMDA